MIYESGELSWDDGEERELAFSFPLFYDYHVSFFLFFFFFSFSLSSFFSFLR